jgi:hypothetical protein
LRSIAGPITSNGVFRVNTVRCTSYARLVGVDLKPIRIERLRLYAQRHGLLENPSALGSAIGKKPNQVYNLLHGQASFGEKVARSIEEAAGLPKGWLDGVGEESSLSPDVAHLAAAVDQLPPRQRDWVLLNLREAVKLARETIADNGAIPSSSNEQAVRNSPSSKRSSAA